jgi:hypothetical protein
MAIQFLLRDWTTASAGDAVSGPGATHTFQASGATSAGAGSATVVIQGSNNNGASWDTIGTITLTLSTSTSSDSFTSDDRYAKVRANVTAISGTDAQLEAAMSY